MDKHIVAGAGVPKGIGPYSQAVVAGGFDFVAGQPGVDPETAESAGDTFAEQATQAFVNLAAVLLAAGSRPDLVVSTTILVSDHAHFAELNRMFGEFFPTEPPTRMVMQVPLPRGLLLSVGCTAIVG